MTHRMKLIRGYLGKEMRFVYECDCGRIIEAWTLKEATEIHKKERNVSK